MLLGKKRKLGRSIDRITIGEKLTLTEKIEDKDLLLYLGLTNDANPLYIQHDYASQTPYEKPIVPAAMLTGIVTSAISKYLPGPGSHVVKQNLSFPKPVYHYALMELHFEVKDIRQSEHLIVLSVNAVDEEGDTVIAGEMEVCPPYRLKSLNSVTLDNF